MSHEKGGIMKRIISIALMVLVALAIISFSAGCGQTSNQKKVVKKSTQEKLPKIPNANKSTPEGDMEESPTPPKPPAEIIANGVRYTIDHVERTPYPAYSTVTSDDVKGDWVTIYFVLTNMTNERCDLCNVYLQHKPTGNFFGQFSDVEFKQHDSSGVGDVGDLKGGQTVDAWVSYNLSPESINPNPSVNSTDEFIALFHDGCLIDQGYGKVAPDPNKILGQIDLGSL